MAEQLFASGEAAERVGLSRSQFLYLIERGDLPSPSYVVPGRRLFTSDDLERIQRILNVRIGSISSEKESPQ